MLGGSYRVAASLELSSSLKQSTSSYFGNGRSCWPGNASKHVSVLLCFSIDTAIHLRALCQNEIAFFSLCESRT